MKKVRKEMIKLEPDNLILKTIVQVNVELLDSIGIEVEGLEMTIITKNGEYKSTAINLGTIIRERR